jgi:hypothetical protein
MTKHDVSKREPRMSGAEVFRNIYRRQSDLSDGWTRCDNRLCKRRKQCCGEDPVFKCADDGSPPREISPEEKAKAMSQLYHGIKARLAERAAAEPPMDPETLRKLRDRVRAAARRRRAASQAGATTTAADSPQGRDENATPMAEATPQLPSDVEERVNRISAEYVAASGEEPGADRQSGPRIRSL